MKASLFALVTASAFLAVHCAPSAQNDGPHDDEFDIWGHIKKELTKSTSQISTTQAPTRTTLPPLEPTTNNDQFNDDEDFALFPPREMHPYGGGTLSSSSSLPEPTTLVPRAASWEICDGTNPDNPYTTANGKKFYYNCDWRYDLLDVNGWHQWFKTTSFRACIDSCSTNDKCNAIWFFKSDSECWLLDAARKQKASELTYNDVSHGIDSAILL